MTNNTWHVKEKRRRGLQERRDKLRALLGKEREGLEVRETFKRVCVHMYTASVLISSERDEEFVTGQNVHNASKVS